VQRGLEELGFTLPPGYRLELGGESESQAETLGNLTLYLPLLLFIGGEFWPPLAVVLAGGVGGSTFLAISFTPAAYRLLVGRRQAIPTSPSLPEVAASSIG
jgi:multidrug efflux pump subunit AcrB